MKCTFGRLKLKEVEVLDQTDEKPTAALIFLHGVGETAAEMKASFIKYLDAPGHPYMKIYFPTPCKRYLLIRDTVTTYWFDCVRVGSAPEDVNGSIPDANDVTDMIESLICDIEASGIPRERIAIGGTSQGGMVTMYATYMQGIKSRAVVSIASSLRVFTRQMKLGHSAVPLLSLYGLKDSMIHPDTMNCTWHELRAAKISFVANSLANNGHYMDADYAKLMFQWLQKKLPNI